MAAALTFHPVTAERWPDFERLFGPRGAYGGCWCMFWRLKRSEFEAGQGEPNRQAMQGIIGRGEIPGLLAYDGEIPVGWCAIAPREASPALDRSPVLKRIDDQPVWSITCFYIAKGYRRHGVMSQILRAAIDHARQHGARIVESYPIQPRKDTVPDMYAYMGTVTAFKKAGFREAARRSASHPVMRYTIHEER